MRTSAIVGAVALLLVPAAAAVHAAQDPQPPVFKSGVELVMVDAQVVDKKGVPITGLTAKQFQVTINGKRRTVVSAELIDAATALPKDGAAGDAEAAARRTHAIGAGGNVYIVAVDQGSFRPVNAGSVVHAVREFLKQVHPSDYVGMFSFPEPGTRIDPTRDRKVLEDALPRLVGFSQLKQMRQFNYSLSDAIDAAARDQQVLSRLKQDNCRDPMDLTCPRALEDELNETVSILEMQAARSLQGLREVIAALASLPGRKTMIVVSAGIPSGDRTGARLYMNSDATQAGQEAAAAGILLYTLQLTTRWLDAFSADAPSAGQTAMREAGAYGKALDRFNGVAGGTFFEVNTGAENAIAHVVRSMSAYYLLGVAVEDPDRDGRAHRIQVKVDQRGANVRSRATVVIPK